MKLYELIDLKQIKRGHDPFGRGFVVVGDTGHYKDVVIFRSTKDRAEDFLKNPNNAYRISKEWNKVYHSRRLEVGDKWDPKQQVQFDLRKDIAPMQSGSN